MSTASRISSESATPAISATATVRIPFPTIHHIRQLIHLGVHGPQLHPILLNIRLPFYPSFSSLSCFKIPIVLDLL